MLSFDRSSLEKQAARVDGRLRPDDPVWQEGDIRPARDIEVSGRLSAAGEGRFYFSGRFDGAVDTECRRCLTAVTVPVAEELHLVFADAGDAEADDSDAYLIDPRNDMVDLRPAVREEWLLAAPAFALCREDCKGLCPRCGADLNQGPCACEPETDRRWDALKALRRDE
jgi:uncharacterized protein